MLKIKENGTYSIKFECALIALCRSTLLSQPSGILNFLLKFTTFLKSLTYKIVSNKFNIKNKHSKINLSIFFHLPMLYISL